ncbi:MAG: GNAT family N-acetyltransferase [Steroidobacteraceae bacterium]
MTNSTTLTTRLARTGDAPALVALVNSAYRGDSSRAGWTTEADLLGGQRTDEQALAEFIDRGETVGDRAMLMYEHDNRPIACVQLEKREDSTYLGMLTISPMLQNAGLGKRLLAAAEAHASRAWQSTRMTMTVIAQRPELIAWYERRGYVQTGEAAAFPYGDPRFGDPKRADLWFIVLAKPLASIPVT